MTQEKYTTRVKLTESERESLLNRMDQAANADRLQSAAGKNNRRRHRRWDFREANTGLTVEHPGGGISRLMICTRNLSAGGLGFVHGGYLHKGSRCRVVLRAIDGRMHPVGGQIVSCRHLEGVLHEIGLQFERKIDPTNFVDTAAITTPTEESIGLESLSGRILYIDDSIDDQNLMKFVIDTCGAELTAVANGMEALAIAESKQFDAILMEMWLPGISGMEIAEMLRQGEYAGPIIAVTADEQPQLKAQAVAKGFTDLLLKPLDFEVLTKLLHKHLPASLIGATNRNGVMAGLKPMYSTHWSDFRMRGLILGFLSRLPSQVKQLQQFVEAADTLNAQRVCMAVKGSAGGYGFAQLSAAAEDVRKLIESAAKPAKIKEQFDVLAQLSAAACLVRSQDDAA